LAAPLAELRSREVTELPEGVPKILRFGGVVVTDLATRQEVQLSGPVDLTRYGARTMLFTDRATGYERAAPGITFLVIEEDGQAVSKPLNVVSKRLIEALHGDLASGMYLKTRYTILGTEPPPRTRYTITREPIPPAAGTV